MPVALYCFARDLRLDDHAGLSAASARGDIVPVLLIDRDMTKRLTSSPRRAGFFCAAVSSLDSALRERGSALIVRHGEAPTLLSQLLRESKAGAVAWSASHDGAGMRRDTEAQAAVEESGARAIVVHDAPAIPPEESTAARSSGSEGYRAFVPYYEVWRELAPGSYEAPLLLSFSRAQLHSEPLPQPQDFGSADRRSMQSRPMARAKNSTRSCVVPRSSIPLRSTCRPTIARRI